MCMMPKSVSDLTRSLNHLKLRVGWMLEMTTGQASDLVVRYWIIKPGLRDWRGMPPGRLRGLLIEPTDPPAGPDRYPVQRPLPHGGATWPIDAEPIGAEMGPGSRFRDLTPDREGLYRARARRGPRARPRPGRRGPHRHRPRSLSRSRARPCRRHGRKPGARRNPDGETS